MKFGVATLVTILAFSAFAGARVVVLSLPGAVRPLAEVETNVVFSTGAAADNKWTLTIERDSAASNSVEVVSYGQVWSTPFDTNALASAGLPFEIVPGLTAFGYEFTPSNSYRFAWADAAVNRDTNNLVSAALELFRNGDVSVTTNGIAAFLPRTLPFPHSGFGQDDEWVTANFTNATEILAVGYPQWVNDQVGEGLTNGLYKLSVTVADDPPETTLLSVGDLSVAITNAGEYVFLLGKSIGYPLAVFPKTATNFSYTAVDDIPSLRSLPIHGMRGGLNDGRWTRDEGRLELVAPISAAQSTPMTAHYPAADTQQVSLSLEAEIGDCTLHSYYAHIPEGQGGGPGVSLTISLPEFIFVNDDDDNNDGTPDCSSTFPDDDDIVSGSIHFSSPQPTNGGIYGVHYHYDHQGNKVWEKGLAPLAFPWTQRNPVHN